jgi:hypothetical protein
VELNHPTASSQFLVNGFTVHRDDREAKTR